MCLSQTSIRNKCYVELKPPFSRQFIQRQWDGHHFARATSGLLQHAPTHENCGYMIATRQSKCGILIWLVVTGTMEFDDFPSKSWEFHHPNRRFVIFFRGVGSTTKQRCWNPGAVRITMIFPRMWGPWTCPKSHTVASKLWFNQQQHQLCFLSVWTRCFSYLLTWS